MTLTMRNSHAEVILNMESPVRGLLHEDVTTTLYGLPRVTRLATPTLPLAHTDVAYLLPPH